MSGFKQFLTIRRLLPSFKLASSRGDYLEENISAGVASANLLLLQ